MQELRIVLIIVGIIAIAGLLAHGFWTSRRNQPEKLVESPKKKSRHQTLEKSEDETGRDDEGFDDLGVSPVRAMGGDDSELEPSDRIDPEFEPSFSAVDEEPESQLASVHVDEVSQEVQEGNIENEAEPPSQSDAEPTAEVAPKEPDDVYVLNVVGVDGKPLKGVKLLPCLTSLGFKFGEMSIFHRHHEANGEGAVIFSLANMVKPGTFELEYMDKFETQGVSLFMTVPCVGEASKNFTVMYNAALRIAQELDGELLDGYRNRFTPQTLGHYQQRVREYERKQLLVN